MFLSVRAMRNARNVRKQLEQEVRKAGLDPTTTATDVDCIARAFTAGKKKPLSHPHHFALVYHNCF